jgi:isoleucyl-tRNA synthetase
VATTDYSGELTISQEILKRVVETYRRIRNTLRFLLANVSDFDGGRDLLPVERWIEIDRYALAVTHDLQAAVLDDYGRYEFHVTTQRLHSFCSEFLGSFYLDILKDRLYTAGANSPARRSAQSALYHITQCALRLFAPILSFTAEEAYEHFVKAVNDSVFLHPYYELPPVSEAMELKQRWGLLREARAEVQKELEALRAKGDIGSSLAAEVDVHTSGDRYRALSSMGDDLRFVLITSAARATEVADSSLHRVDVRPSQHKKCARCWHYRADVDVDAKYPELCGRCVSNLYGLGEARGHA